MAATGLTARSPIVAIAGLHGGAGTTTLALALAQHAAAAAPPGSILLTETDPRGGGLALALDASSSTTLAELARVRGAGAAAPSSPLAQLPDGLRIIAAPPAERSDADPGDVADTLRDAGAAHAMTVVDCGTIREPHAVGAFEAATAIVWVTAPGAATRRVGHLLHGPLADSARRAPWILAVSDIAGDGRPDSLDDLRALTPMARHVVLVPRLDGTPASRRDDVGRDLVQGLRS